MRASDPHQSAAALVCDTTATLYPQPITWTAGIGKLSERFFWPLFGAVISLMAFNAFYALDSMHVRDFDEARYGVAASEMLHSHSPLVTTYAGATEFWNLKPPLGYWLLELSYRAFGETPFALRAPAAFCGVMIVMFTMVYARSIAGSGVALLSGAILSTCFGFLGHHAARSGDLDVPLALTLFLTLPIIPKLSAERWARLALGLLFGLAFLIKSFAILPFIAAAAVSSLVIWGPGFWRSWLLPMLIVVLIAVTWAVSRSVAENSWEFVFRMVSEDLLQRSTSEIDPGGSSLWDYAGCLLDRMAPWSIVVAASLLFARSAIRRRLDSRHWVSLWCYALIPVVLFTIARTHHSWYIVPTYPAWAILAGGAIVDLIRRAGSIEVESIVVAVVVAIGLTACEWRILSRLVVGSRMPDGQLFLQSLGHGRPGRGEIVATAFTPSYSERFLLQSVDGLVLTQPDSLFGPSSRPRPTARWMLFHITPSGILELPPDLREPRVYLHGDGYAVAEIAADVSR